jgi:glycosyltransferase involved in cell wall biosynthesis
MKVLHVITGLGQGGAEAVLRKVLSSGRPELVHEVVSLTSFEENGKALQDEGVRVTALGMHARRVWPAALGTLYRLIRRSRPDVVQTWMYHADLVGGVIARLAGVRYVVWGIRQSDPRANRLATRVVARLCAFLSGVVPAGIVSCSRSGAAMHRAAGYADRFVVIANGFDTNVFCPDGAGRDRIRREWGVGPEVPVVGMVSRWHPLKGHEVLLDAVRIVRQRGGHSRVVLIGTGCDERNTTLVNLIAERGLTEIVRVCGSRSDIPAVMNALDVHVLASYEEGLPNVVGEAMACGTPCVVTDVGDAAALVGETGWIAVRGDSGDVARALALALAELSQPDKWVERQRLCRQRVVGLYDVQKMIGEYESLWYSALAENVRRG